MVWRLLRYEDQCHISITPSSQYLQVGDDAQSVHNFHPITEAKTNPFRSFTDEETDTVAEEELNLEQPVDSPSDGNRRMSLPQMISMSRESSFGDFVMDVFIKKESGQGLPGRARLDTGMTRNAVSKSVALMLGYPIDEYNGDPCIVADGSFYYPIGQVTLPFHFVNFRTAQTWHVEFIVFPEGSPFDICLGRRFISLADLLKRNPEALPVEFRKLKPGKFDLSPQRRARTNSSSRRRTRKETQDTSGRSR